MLITGALRRILLLSCGLPTALLLLGCPRSKPPEKPASYTDQVAAFTRGTLALETAVTPEDRIALTLFTKIAPDEPAGWANLGLVELRAGKLEKAGEYLNKAAALAPESAAIQKLLGLLTGPGRMGDINSAVTHYKKAVELAPNDLRARADLAQALDGSGAGGLAEEQQQVAAIVALHPDNLAAILDLARTAATRNDMPALKQAISLLEARSSTFERPALDQLQKVKAALASNDSRRASREATFLGNYLKSNTAFHTSFLALHGIEKAPGQPLEQFLKLPPIPATPATPDTGLTFAAAPVAGAGKSAWADVIWLTADGKPVVLTADGKTVHIGSDKTLSFPGGPAATPPGPAGILPLDVNYDERMDFALAGRGGFKLYQQGKTGNFTDVTAKTTLPAAILNAAYGGAWQLDVEQDGDIDILLAPVTGPPVVVRNNGDGTWKAINPFPGVTNVRQFTWTDLNDDGSPDAVFVDAAGKLHIYMNQRAGLYSARPAPAGLGKLAAIAVGSFKTEGSLSLLALQTDGKIKRIRDKGADWEVTDLVAWPNPPANLSIDTARLFLADLDNNGGPDLVAYAPGQSQFWLCNEQYDYAPLPVPGAGDITAIADLDGDGQLDLVGLNAAHQPTIWTGKGTRGYHWQEIRPRPADSEITGIREKGGGVGDKRINPYAIGGELELRAGLLYSRQEILSPVVHFGLGAYPRLDALRLVWPNGTVRSEFADESTDPKRRINPDQIVTAVHTVDVSCPFLFAWNGKEMQFVTDCIWRSPLGLKINAIDTAGVSQTEDWLKIRGDQLVPHDGVYDLRITAELWETHFFDHLSLLTVDHPVGTDIWVDERFSIPPPPHRVYVTGPPHAIARAVDDRGADVTELVRERDGRHVDTFGRGEYQGVTRDHWLEVTLPEDAPRTGPLWLVCYGWIRPTNSSVNVALGQSHFPQPQGLSIETPDAQGRWHVARKGLGFPEGKVKTILLSMDGLFAPGAPRRLRLRTNLEIYWDAIQWAAGLPQTPAKIRHLAAKTADLGYRGFSVIRAKDESSPELPQSYDQLERQDQKWSDLIGYYTRYGDVRELLANVDDRYVIMNSGDELRLTFAAPPMPPAGMTRDYVLIGDGWVKDGIYNTTYSKTVLPLPLHGHPDYNAPPGRLQDDPAYKRHPRDWEIYHTRYVTPDLFARGFRPELPASPRPASGTLTQR